MPADKSLIPVENDGWSAGFGSMLRKENARWWNLKSLAIQIIVWSLVINGLVAIQLFVLPGIYHSAAFTQALNNSSDSQAQQLAESGYFNTTPEQDVNSALQSFFGFGGLAFLIGAVILAHDSILKERETGTAAWLLSKPLSRKAFVLSKALASSLGMLAMVVLVQGILAYALCSFALGRPIALLPFLIALGIMGLLALFYLLLSLMLGAFTTSRAMALGIPIIIGLIAGNFVAILWEDAFRFGPWALSGTALKIATGSPLASVEAVPVLATAAWIVVFIAAATWRFDRLEL